MHEYFGTINFINCFKLEEFHWAFFDIQNLCIVRYLATLYLLLYLSVSTGSNSEISLIFNSEESITYFP